jgi:hypothetical protein
MRHVLGPADFTYTLERYRSASRAEGLSLAGEEDITKNTLPTYDILRKLTPEMGIHNRTARFGVGALEWLCRTRLVRYKILSFERPFERVVSGPGLNERRTPAPLEG